MMQEIRVAFLLHSITFKAGPLDETNNYSSFHQILPKIRARAEPPV